MQQGRSPCQVSFLLMLLQYIRCPQLAFAQQLAVFLKQRLFLNLYLEMPKKELLVPQMCVISMCFFFELLPRPDTAGYYFVYALSYIFVGLLCYRRLVHHALPPASSFDFWSSLFSYLVPKPHHELGTINEVNLLQGRCESHKTSVDKQAAPLRGCSKHTLTQ